jgi:endonuclease YncB( thermonuclease family)
MAKDWNEVPRKRDWFADFSGPVVSILNCDTIEVRHNNKAERIRLHSIDCPEKNKLTAHEPSKPLQS